RNGVTIATLSGTGSAFSKFSYGTAGGGTFTVTLTVSDKDGGAAPPVTALSIVGGAGNDVIAITPAVIAAAGAGVTQVLAQGLGGNDTITTDPNDSLPLALDGGAGDDYYRVHFSTVQLFETGTGTDTIDLTDAPQGVTFNLSIQDGTAQTVFTGSTLAVTGPFESVVGSNYGDKLTTASSGTTLFGGLGDDSLTVAG